MANNWFQFKEFKIQQDKCGMKVSTDACIQGANAADFLLQKPELKSVLDIGTGTGLLSLFLVQKRNDLIIDALEIEQNSFEQAQENFKDSRWNSQLTVHHCAVQNWRKENISKYDFIICNPPFFQNHLQSEQEERNTARHNVSLSSEDLIHQVIFHLKDTGIFCLLFPKTGWDQFADLAERNGLYINKLIFIQPKPHLEYNRIIAFFTKTKSAEINRGTFTIYQMEKEYTEEFKELLKDYYLYL